MFSQSLEQPHGSRSGDLAMDAVHQKQEVGEAKQAHSKAEERSVRANNEFEDMQAAVSKAISTTKQCEDAAASERLKSLKLEQQAEEAEKMHQQAVTEELNRKIEEEKQLEAEERSRREAELAREQAEAVEEARRAAEAAEAERARQQAEQEAQEAREEEERVRLSPHWKSAEFLSFV